MLGNALGLDLLTNHEAGDVLQEHDWDLSLRAHLHEMGSLLSALREKHTVIGHNTNWVAVDVAETSNEGRTEALLELMETRAVQDPTKNHVHVELLLVVDWDDTVQLVLVEERGLRAQSIVLVLSEEILDTKVGDNRSCDLEGMLLVFSEVVRNARFLAVEVGTTKFLLSDTLSSGSLHQWWTTQENGSTLLDHNDLVTHGWHISTTSSAAAHHNSNLGDTLG